MRWVELEGCASFRDIGGYATSDGRRTKWATVYRSGALDGVTSSDGRMLSELAIRTVIDLREEDECSAAVFVPAADVLRIPERNPGAASLRRGEYDPVALYLVDLEQRGRDFASVLVAVANAERLPALIQCSGGKDRTG